MTKDTTRGSLTKLFEGIEGLEFTVGCAENYSVILNEREIAIVHDLPDERFRSADVLRRSKVGKRYREVYDKVVNRLEEQGYAINRSRDLIFCIRVVT